MIPKNTNPEMPWNKEPYKSDPSVPHNNPLYGGDPLKPWNDFSLDENDLNDEEKRAYGINSPNDFGDDDWGSRDDRVEVEDRDLCFNEEDKFDEPI